ncbi:hypothetical protein [uncultured Subdoligranulum sp.]|uniref:hypothetical protein n=1 Tax=uncultured Subdoligranulum sp. TaxID=512298 RepID=UPI00262DEEA6|nr:hypothetical protein [uncultured Subdoligranulum sp.]
MAGKAKFDQEAAFKQIIGADREPGEQVTEQPVKKNKSKDRVQRSYFLDRDLDKALRRMALDKEKNLTETINEILRMGLEEYLK